MKRKKTWWTRLAVAQLFKNLLATPWKSPSVPRRPNKTFYYEKHEKRKEKKRERKKEKKRKKKKGGGGRANEKEGKGKKKNLLIKVLHHERIVGGLSARTHTERVTNSQVGSLLVVLEPKSIEKLGLGKDGCG